MIVLLSKPWIDLSLIRRKMKESPSGPVESGVIRNEKSRKAKGHSYSLMVTVH